MRTLLLLSCVCVFACGDDDPPTPMCDGEVGSNGCQCRPDESCDEGLVCSMGMCGPASASGLVFPAGARACELRLTEASGRVADVVFTDVEGTFVRESPNVAIAVMVNADTDFPAGAAQILGTADGDFSIAESTCVDSTGAIVAEGVVLQ